MLKKKAFATTFAATLLLSSLGGVASAQSQDNVALPQMIETVALTTVAQTSNLSFEKVYQTFNLAELELDSKEFNVTSISPTQFVVKMSINLIAENATDMNEMRSIFGNTMEIRFTKQGNAYKTEVNTTGGWISLNAQEEAELLSSLSQDRVLEREGGYFHDTLNHWAEPYVQYLYELGIINGVNATTFNPNGQITRGQLAAMIFRTIGFSLDEDFETYAPYQDIQNHQFGKEISVLYDYGLLEIFDDSYFNPNQPATREEVAATVYALISTIKEGNPNYSINFKDANEIDDLAKEGIAYLQQEGIISGYNDGTFKPKNNVTRAQFTKILSLTIIKTAEKMGEGY